MRGTTVRHPMSRFSTIETIGVRLAIVCPFLANSVSLSRDVDVHVYHLVIHSLESVGGVVSGSGLEVKAVEEITSEGGGVGKDHLLSTPSSHALIHFTGHVNPVLDGIFWRRLLIVNLVHDLRI